MKVQPADADVIRTSEPSVKATMEVADGMIASGKYREAARTMQPMINLMGENAEHQGQKGLPGVALEQYAYALELEAKYWPGRMPHTISRIRHFYFLDKEATKPQPIDIDEVPSLIREHAPTLELVTPMGGRRTPKERAGMQLLDSLSRRLEMSAVADFDNGRHEEAAKKLELAVDTINTMGLSNAHSKSRVTRLYERINDSYNLSMLDRMATQQYNGLLDDAREAEELSANRRGVVLTPEEVWVLEFLRDSEARFLRTEQPLLQ